MSRKNLNNEEIKFLYENYPTKGWEFCAKQLNLTKIQIYDMCARRNIRRFKRIKVDHNQFVNVSTPETAYILGLIFGDGNLSDKRDISVALVKEDMDSLLNIFKKTGDWNQYSRQMLHWKPSLRLRTSNKQLFNYLESKGYKSKSEGSAQDIINTIPEWDKLLEYRE